ncbi:hypothetical protein G7Y89_g11811 [Cudoniella acicularis]|uniref:Alpha-galactosidase n=1 Tax=Cudoniella acicularis TaxID=354080 RepID=A0A8H4VXZ2_9HELO|nr:hypothetical protein G7Y89_g11811 [Cudoniella acicularis]
MRLQTVLLAAAFVFLTEADDQHRPPPPTTPALSNGLAKTPPMGFSTWNQFGDQISEQLIIETIDTMASNGLRDAGFVFINLDDGWQRYPGNRSYHPGPIEADPVKFPKGIKYLSDYAHSKGFKFGIYNGPGQQTCAGYIGSEGHVEEDAATWASWGVDHLKYDSCCSEGPTAPQAEVETIFRNMSLALLATKRPIVFHACHCGWADIWKWAAHDGANQWRIGQDIPDDFNYPGYRDGYYFDVLEMLDRGRGLEKYSGPGHWNDYDMLIVGLNGNSTQLEGTGCSNVEYRSHFTMWCMVASPLLIGADVRTLSAYDLQTLTNKEVIAISQDPLGKVATVVHEDLTLQTQVYAKDMSDGSKAVAYLNRGTLTANITVDPFKDLHVWWKQYHVRDLWKHQDMGIFNFSNPYMVEVFAHEVKALRFTPIWS